MILILKHCLLCNIEFESNKLSQKYCSDKCRLAKKRENDRARKRKKRAEEKEILDKEIHRIQEAEREAKKKVTQERRKAKEKELKERASQGDALARMILAKPLSYDYWEAHQQYEIEQHNSWDSGAIRIVNEISIFEECFAEKVVQSISKEGRIYSRLISLRDR